MDEHGGWRPSPAYDLTLSTGPGGEPTTLVAGEGRSSGPAHLAALGRDAELKHVPRIIDEVRSAVARLRRFADEAGVPARLRERVARALGLGPTSTRGRAAPRPRSCAR